MDEPLIHSHISDVLPDSHALAFEQVHCDRCEKLVHASNNECMSTWLEWNGEKVCIECALPHLGLVLPDTLPSAPKPPCP